MRPDGDVSKALLGPSGCGKSMTLKSIAGIIRLGSGGRIVTLRYGWGKAVGGPCSL